MFGKKQNHHEDKQFFSIYDSKTGHYWLPMVAINSQDMIRQVTNQLAKPDSFDTAIGRNPEDYSLFLIGSFDQKTGYIKPCEPVVHIANIHELKSSLQPRGSIQMNQPYQMAAMDGGAGPEPQ